ncbi:putative ankyrin repeat-containing protein [Xylaria acuta]|nr:putative ankyrin repeat-containing protein [Xylaria acuta]
MDQCSRPNTPTTKMAQKLLRDLYVVPYKDHKDRNPERAPGTCKWFTSHDRFKNWQKKGTSSLLWVSADPGCGKSVLAKYLVDKVIPSTGTSTTCYFFFKDGFEDQTTVENALRCILRQLLDQKRELLSNELLEKFETGGATTFTSFSDLWYLLTSVARYKNAGTIVCLLDAFDECEEKGRVRLAQALNKFYKQESSASTLKFLITSRPYASIQRDFQTLEDDRPTIHLQGENQTEIDKISLEIDAVIKYKLEALRAELKLQSDEARSLYLRFTSIPHRTYLWVYLTFDEIRSYNGPVSFNLEDTTYALPRTVGEAYERILAKSSNMTEARRLLHIVLAASRPLTLHEISLALGLRENSTPYRDIQIEPTDRFRSTMRDLCGLFVVVVDSKVYLLHQTAREFLLGKQMGNHRFQWGGSFRLQESGHILATICVRYLHHIISGLPNDKNHGFLGYAAQNWALHFREASDEVETELELSALQLCDPSSQLCVTWVERYRDTTVADFPGQPTALILASFFGLHKLVTRILSQGVDSLGVTDTEYRRTSLTWASCNGYEGVVQLILERLSRTKEIFRRGLPWKTSVTDSKDKAGRTALFHAAMRGHYSISKMLIKKGASLKIRDEYRQTSISLATHYGHKRTIELLYKHGARLESQDEYTQSADKSGFTPLSRAINLGEEDIIQMLLDMNAGVEALSEDGSGPLHNAIQTRNIKVVQLLLDKGVNTEKPNFSHRTPLLLAVNQGFIEGAQLLLERGVLILKQVINTAGQHSILQLPTATQILYGCFLKGVLLQGLKIKGLRVFRLTNN